MTNLIPEIPDELKMQIYQDSIKNSLQTVSKTFSDAWYLVFGWISQIADKRKLKYFHNLKCYQQELSNEINKTPEDKLIEPDIQVTAQALENSKYCIESEELRKMFVNLISKSINADYEATVHPSFAEIIKQMSPTDAKILKTIPLKSNIPLVDYIVTDSANNSQRLELTNIYLSGLPNIDIFKECATISSLSRLGILNIDKTRFITDTSIYKPYKETPFFKALAEEKSYPHSTLKADLKKYLGNLTPLGQNFVVTCVL